MYLDIGNNTLIDENEIIAVVNVSDKFFKDFCKNDLDYTKNCLLYTSPSPRD